MIEVHQISTDTTHPDCRVQPRTHLFVIATLYSADTSTAVHVRNMSSRGALIEGALLPDVGTAVQLKRGSLQAAGMIAWRAGRRAGVAFSTFAHVADWMARQTSPQQQRADELIRTVKSGVAVSETAVATCQQAQRSIREELQALKAELASLGSALCGDMILVATHPEIQVLDVSVQRIERVLSRLGAYPRC